MAQIHMFQPCTEQKAYQNRQYINICQVQMATRLLLHQKFERLMRGHSHTAPSTSVPCYQRYS